MLIIEAPHSLGLGKKGCRWMEHEGTFVEAIFPLSSTLTAQTAPLSYVGLCLLETSLSHLLELDPRHSVTLRQFLQNPPILSIAL